MTKPQCTYRLTVQITLCRENLNSEVDQVDNYLINTNMFLVYTTTSVSMRRNVYSELPILSISVDHFYFLKTDVFKVKEASLEKKFLVTYLTRSAI